MPRHRWLLGIVVGLTKSNDRLFYDVKIKIGKIRNFIRHSVNRLCPTRTCAAEQLYRNVRNVRNTRTNDVDNNNSTKFTHSKRNAAVGRELRRLLNDTDVNPRLVIFWECSIYDYIIFL